MYFPFIVEYWLAGVLYPSNLSVCSDNPEMDFPQAGYSGPGFMVMALPDRLVIWMDDIMKQFRSVDKFFSSVTCDPLVITSYSIHYTKLYDIRKMEKNWQENLLHISNLIHKIRLVGAQLRKSGILIGLTKHSYNFV